MSRTRRGIVLAALLAQPIMPARAQTTASPPEAPAPAAPPAVAVPAPMPATPAAVAPAEKLTGAAAWGRLKGNTISGKDAGGAIAEYFDAGGGVKYVDKDGMSEGTWTVQKDKVCFDFPDDDDRTCTTFEVTGSSGIAKDDDGDTLKFDVLQGNAKGL